MSLFTEEQLKELEIVFNLKRVASLPVRDGQVNRTDYVYWRSDEGPEHVLANDHWDNIKGSPQYYSLKEPRTAVQYLD